MNFLKFVMLVAFCSYAISGHAGDGYGGGYTVGNSERSADDSRVSTGTGAKQAVKQVDTSIGSVYSTVNGMTLYTFSMDTGPVSSCYEACAASWPPFSASAQAKPWGAFTIIVRSDGSYQWAYNEQPLYTWVGDKKEGDTSGHGVGNVWFAAQP